MEDVWCIDYFDYDGFVGGVVVLFVVLVDIVVLLV